MRWYPVELHTHTCHSDGSFTVEELVRRLPEMVTGRWRSPTTTPPPGCPGWLHWPRRKEFCRYGDWSGPHITAIWWCWRKTVIPTGEA